MTAVSPTSQDCGDQRCSVKFPAQGQGHSHRHHCSQPHEKTNLNPRLAKEYLCNEYPKIVFQEKYTSQSYQILKTLSPALFPEKGRGRKYSLEFEGQLNWMQPQQPPCASRVPLVHRERPNFLHRRFQSLTFLQSTTIGIKEQRTNSIAPNGV